MDSFYDELARVFYGLYEIFVKRFQCENSERKCSSRQTVGSESFQDINNDCAVRTVTFAQSNFQSSELQHFHISEHINTRNFAWKS